MVNHTVICLMGPTASGKTDLALELVDTYPLEIISVDSAMLYRGMDIGSAKPDAKTLARYPHHLINIREVHHPYSAADFAADATRLISEIHARGKIPLLVGGTMLYFHALQTGLSEIPTADPAIRQHLQLLLKTQGLPVLYERLQKIDPEACQKIHAHDPQRILRALEIYEATGLKLSAFWASAEKNISPHHFVNLGIIPSDRSILHTRIAARFRQMLDAGFLEEVERLRALPNFNAELPAFKAVGYRQALECLEGKFPQALLEEKACAATRQLAKRQLTWLRSWKNLTPFDLGDRGVIDQVKKCLSLF